MSPYFTEALNSTHEKEDFACGNEILDSYIKQQAGQDVKRKLSVCFVCVHAQSKLVKAYYTLSSSSIPLDMVPAAFKKNLPPSYISIPCTLLGRLAIDSKFQNQGLGKMLLIDALRRAYEISKSIGSFAIIVDPIDDNAKSYYTKFGFIQLPDSGKMFIAMKTVEMLF